MKVGIGLPAAVPERAAMEMPRWAVDAERFGFHSLGCIDRLVYDNIEPLVALAAAAAVTDRVELFTAVLNVGWRNNPVLLAKQLASVDLISAGRLTAGMALGAWPEDYEHSGVASTGKGRAFDEALDTLRRSWGGELSGVAGPMSKLPSGRPGVLIGGLVPAAHARVARCAEGWVAPTFGYEVLVSGVRAVRDEWAKAGRPGRPRIVTGRYFSCGPDADAQCDRYLQAYYGTASDLYFELARRDSLTSDDQLRAELTRLADAEVDDVVLLPCDSSPAQVEMLAAALDRIGARRGSGFEVFPR